MNLKRILPSIILSLAVSPPCVGATVAVPNASIERVVEGRYENRNVPDGAVLGTESFRLTVHRDGSRCLLIWSNSASRGTQISSHVCVDAAFRPTEAYARYWVGGSYRGSGWIRVTGAKLALISANAEGVTSTAETPVPLRFSIGTHPISGDAWHVAALGPDSAREATSFTFNPSGSGAQPLTGSLVQIPVERSGNEKVKVPAGEFDTRRIKLSGQTTYWVTGEDWLVVKASAGASERVLVEFRSY